MKPVSVLDYSELVGLSQHFIMPENMQKKDHSLVKIY